MKILYINPVATGMFDEYFREVLDRAVDPGTEVVVEHFRSLEAEAETPFLPPEPFYLTELMKMVKKAEVDGFNAVVIGCSADPGLREAKAMVRIPVTAPLEANLHIASMLRTRVAIMVPAGPEARILYWDLARSYGLDHFISSINSIVIGYPPPGEIAAMMRQDPEQVRRVVMERHQSSILGELAKVARRAVAEEGAGVIYCGCTLWTGMTEPLARDLGVPVLDPGVGAVRVAEMLALACG